MKRLLVVLALIPISLTYANAVDTEIIINGPSFGIGNNLDEDYTYSEDRILSKSGGLGIKIYKNPIYISFFGAYKSYGSHYSPTTPDFSRDKATEYTGTSGNCIVGFRIMDFGPLVLFPAVSAGYQRLDYEKSRSGYYYDYVNDISRYATMRDKGDYTELTITGGVLVNFDISERFQSDTYCGFGYGNIENSSVWTMVWMSYPVVADVFGHEYAISGFTVYLNSNNRISINELIGINIGVELMKRPISPGYGYIPESYYRISEWDSFSYNVWVGPSFSL